MKPRSSGRSRVDRKEELRVYVEDCKGIDRRCRGRLGEGQIDTALGAVWCLHCVKGE